MTHDAHYVVFYEVLYAVHDEVGTRMGTWREKQHPWQLVMVGLKTSRRDAIDETANKSRWSSLQRWRILLSTLKLIVGRPHTMIPWMWPLLWLTAYYGVSASGRVTDSDLLQIKDEGPSPNGKVTTPNVTKLDCGIRELALEYAMTLNSDPQLARQVFDALRLDTLCGNTPPASISNEIPTNNEPGFSTMEASLKSTCASPKTCLYVVSAMSSGRSRPSNLRQPFQKDVGEDGSRGRPFSSIHDAIDAVRSIRKSEDTSKVFTIVLGSGIHELQGRTIQLLPGDSGLSIIGYPGEQVWLSGGISLDSVEFEQGQDTGVYAGNLTAVLEGYVLPNILSLFSTDRRWIRARYPNANPETDQWGYASPNRFQYSISSEKVLEWHLPPKGIPPNFTFVDFQDTSPPNVPRKNNSMQRGYNWFASGHGGVCADVWGTQADSYWCSNASQGGWAEVDQECATSGQSQLPIGLTYNTSSELQRFQSADLQGGILHAWHSQSWAMHMFEITRHMSMTGVIQLANGGGRQGGRNWCRCDQCTYAASWCGQHQTPAWKDQRLISGTWMIENVFHELDQIGEYYFDRVTKVIYVIPNATIDLVDLRVAVLEQLVSISGAANVTIENIGFRDTAPTYHPNSDWSAPSGGDWSLHRGGSIFVENALHVTIRNCRFRRLDGNAVFLSRRTRNVTFESSYFEWLGENAIATWGDTDGYDATGENFPMYTTIRGNVMRELGIFEKQSSAVGQAKAAHTHMLHNIMFNMPRAAINFNDMVGGGDVVHGNLIFNTCRESGDHGPINSWDRQPFLTTLRDGQTKSFDPVPRKIDHNFIIANYGASQGVDNDDGSSWFHIHHNLFYSAEGFKMDYGGHDSIFEDNLIMAFPYDGSQCFNMGSFYKGHGDILRRNRCLVGLGNRMGSGCGDPSCASPVPDTNESQQIVGYLWGGCQDSAVELSENDYFTPDGEAKIGCGDDLSVPLGEFQSKYGMEIGSSKAPLPDENTMIAWARDMLPGLNRTVVVSSSR